MNLNVQRGAFVSEVLPDSGSAKAGIKSGDVIVSLNGKPLNSFAELRSRIATTEPGTKVKLGLLRDGKPVDVEVTLDKQHLLNRQRGTDYPGAAGGLVQRRPDERWHQRSG